jgi:hypothetical protein
MTDTVQVALIVSIGPTLIGLLNVLHQMMAVRKMVIIGDGVKRVETQTNGIKDALVAATTKVAHAEGMKDEKLRASLETIETAKTTHPLTVCEVCDRLNPSAICPMPEANRPSDCPLRPENAKT